MGVVAACSGFLIVLLIVGLIAGAIARLLVPGRDPMGVIGTIGLGVAGSFLGDYLQNLIVYHSVEIRHPHATGISGSVIGAIVVLLLLRLTSRGRGARRGY